MPTPDLILQKPLILILPTDSVLSGTPMGTALNFGNVELVYGTCDAFEVGDVVLYNTIGQTLVNYSGVEYAIIEEEKILYKEVPIP